MKTDELIACLAADLAPAPKAWARRRLFLGVTAGLGGGLLLWLLFYGPREDLIEAAATWPFWMKFLYTTALCASGLWLLARSGRPGAAMAPPAVSLLAPVGLVVLAAGLTLADPDADLPGLILGHSAATCSLTIALISLPALAGAFWALRQLAPTRLTEAGAGAGLFAGSEGALLYAFYCTEEAAPFVALWYTLGILLTATLGAFLGRALLRW
jgi:hypothetical protein